MDLPRINTVEWHELQKAPGRILRGALPCLCQALEVVADDAEVDIASVLMMSRHSMPA